MRPQEFDFELPPDQIAQRPLDQRDSSRLMVVDRGPGSIVHCSFRDLPSLLSPSDLLVVNESGVIPARLVGRKPAGGRVEFLLVRPVGGEPTSVGLQLRARQHEWICLGKAAKPLRPGLEVDLGVGWRAQVVDELAEGGYRVRFGSPAGEPLAALLERVGQVPLPPYIRRQADAEDRARYQTVYAATPGSVAAPTAGLHFTTELLAELEQRGIQRAAVSLDVGPGTFLPVREEMLEDHRMHSERYFIPPGAKQKVRETKSRGGRIVAVGTTVVRALESAVDPATGELRTGAAETSLFIRPGFKFQIVDALLTNFHLPKSTLIVLVSAFCGRETILHAYREAIQRGYRFFSYGDAMLIS